MTIADGRAGLINTRSERMHKRLQPAAVFAFSAWRSGQADKRNSPQPTCIFQPLPHATLAHRDTRLALRPGAHWAKSRGSAAQERATTDVTIQLSNIRMQPSALKWLILFGLLWSQLAYASHPILHESGDSGEPCRVCAGLDRLESALDFADTPRLPVIPVSRETAGTVGPGSRLPANAYSARASPQRI